MSEVFQSCFDSPIGRVIVEGSADAVSAVYFWDGEIDRGCPAPPCLSECIRQLEKYFKGTRRTFDIPLALKSSAFQERVWQQLQKIPYGQTVTYQEVALELGDANAVRAVGSANGQNPVSIIVPCHRVIGSNGKLIGYGGGLWRKEWLLRHEGCLLV